MWNVFMWQCPQKRTRCPMCSRDRARPGNSTSLEFMTVERVVADLGTTAESARRDRLRAMLGGAGVDALLITDLVNVRYLTGFTGSNGGVVITAAGDDRIATDGRYITQVAEQAPDLTAIIN